VVPGTAVQRVTQISFMSALVPTGEEWQRMRGHIHLKKWFRLDPSVLQQAYCQGSSVTSPSWYLRKMALPENVTSWDSGPVVGRTWYNSTVTFRVSHGDLCMGTHCNYPAK
jgi:hypothetical protein